MKGNDGLAQHTYLSAHRLFPNHKLWLCRYALMGKRRFMEAAAFFLLGEQLIDAVSLCLETLQDVQLGMVVARLYVLVGF
jgi:hypothetical protein